VQEKERQCLRSNNRGRSQAASEHAPGQGRILSSLPPLGTPQAATAHPYRTGLPLPAQVSTSNTPITPTYGTHDVDKYVQPRPLGHLPHQARRIPFFALLHAPLQVAIECLDAPLSVGRVERGCKGRSGLVCAQRDGAEVERNRAVAAHRVPADALPGKVQWEPLEGLEEGGQLGGHVCVHFVVRRPRRVGCI
jgi:hypothetical protein